MASLAFAIPILPGKTEAWNRVAAEVQGPRRAEFEEYHRRVGITRENWYLQPLPSGDVVIVYFEANDVPAALKAIQEADDPFARWLKEQWRQTEGLNWREAEPPLAQVVLESR